MSVDCYLFNPTDIEDLDWTDVQSDWKVKLDTNLSIIRPLKIDDYDRGHIKLLSQLTDVGDVSQQEFEGRSDIFLIKLNLHCFLLCRSI